MSGHLSHPRQGNRTGDIVGEIAVGDDDGKIAVGVCVVRVSLKSGALAPPLDDRRPDSGILEHLHGGGGGDGVVGMSERGRRHGEEFLHQVAMHKEFGLELREIGELSGDAVMVGLGEEFDV